MYANISSVTCPLKHHAYVNPQPHYALIMKNEDTNRFIQEYLDSSKIEPSLTTDMITEPPAKTEDFLHDEVGVVALWLCGFVLLVLN